MRIHTIFQLLSYYCLCQINNLAVDSIGLVLPLQLKIIKYNLSNWEWKPFYQALTDCINDKMVQACLWDIDSFIHDIFLAEIEEHVGFHCHNDQLVSYMNKNIPALQFFVNGNVNGNVKFDKQFMNQLNIQTKSKVYIHSPYILNLSHPGKNSKGTFDLGDDSYGGYTFDCLTKLLQYARDVNVIRGVVVHLGKTCGESYHESVFNMYFSVIACSSWATPECKLLLETCCDQKGEILADPNELCDFYLSLPDCVREVVSICVDSSHVCAAGFDTYEFIKILEQRNVPIDLIHYNDAKLKCGCKKDRHAMIGEGYLGYDTLNAVLQYGILHHIPMLRE
jgi:deoxyribonuclease-4